VRKSDVAPAALMLGLSGAILLETRNLGFWSDTTPGPAFLPVWLAVAAVVLCVLRLAEARRGVHDLQWPERPALARIALIFAGLVAVPLLTPLAGMLPALALFMAYLLLLVLRQPLWPSLATIGVTGALVYGIFVSWLGVPLPRGVIGI
jgi:putative tricarboxylic transport membrane protein